VDYFALALNASTDDTGRDNLSEAASDLDNRINEEQDSFDFNYVAQTQDEAQYWAGKWGGSANWPYALEVGYAAAKEIGELEVNEWVRNVLVHAERGRYLIQTLEGMKGWLPKEMWKIREIWRRVLESLGVLHRGVACIEVRVDIIRLGSSSFNLLSNTPVAL
jgi:hypothetical protein